MLFRIDSISNVFHKYINTLYIYTYSISVWTTLLTIARLFQGQSSIHRSNRPVHRSGGSIKSRVVTNVIDRVSMELHRCNFPFHSRIAYPCLPRVFDKQRSFVLRYVILCLFPTFIFIKRIQDYRVIIYSLVNIKSITRIPSYKEI